MVSHALDTNPASSTLRITDVTVKLWDQSSKWVQSISILIDGVTVSGELEQTGSSETSQKARVSLKSPRAVESSLVVTAQLRYETILKSSWRDHKFEINPEVFRGAHRQEGGRRVWERSDGKISVTVGLINSVARDPILSPGNASILSTGLSSFDGQGRLTPTTEEILRECPQFRILVMGKTGVGKSSLINKAFGVNDAVVAHDRRGYADINKEIYSDDNPEFILHDSKGFEHGDDINVKTVHDFVNARSKEPLTKNKLHAIWLCIEIPTYGARLLEAGIEEFLKLKAGHRLGHVPIIAVFTKYDQLVDHLQLEMKSSDDEVLSEDAFDRLLTNKVEARLRELCTDPLEKFVSNDLVPSIVVSSEPGYETRLNKLVKLTYDRVYNYLVDAAAVVAMAQKINPKVKIEESIRVGQRSAQFVANSDAFDNTLGDCFDVIHADIIAVWRFNDPNKYLASKEFKALISNLPSQPSDQSKPPYDLKEKLVASMSLLAAIAGIVGAMAGPQAPIVIPIVAAFVFGKWVYEAYQETTNNLRHLMEYIIDLTLVMQNIFWLQVLFSRGRPLSRRHIKAAANSYLVSNTRQTLCFEIDKHIDSVKFNLGSNTTKVTIEQLIKSSIIDTEEVVEQQTDLSRYGDIFAEETYAEEWDTPAS